MFCQKCNLHYHDHLSFCRRCGQPLARSAADHAVDSHCCTRCGARVVRGENFCQQCGNRIGVALQDTVIGACYHCGTSWRSGWLFCKNCGLDRKRALLLSTSSPSAGSSLFASAKSNGVEHSETLPEIAKINCQFCGAEAKPFSRFCESCGRRIDGTNSPGSIATPVEVASVQPQEDPSPANPKPPNDQLASAPTRIEPEPLLENDLFIQASDSGEAIHSPTNSSSGIAALSGNKPRTENQNPPISAVIVPQPREESVFQNKSAGEPAQSHTETVVTPLPPFGRVPDEDSDPVTFEDIWTRNKQAILQSAVLLGLVVLLGAVVVWWFANNRSRETKESDSASPAVAKPHPVRSSSPTSEQSASTVVAPVGMIYVPGGKFEMGRADGDEYERPAHTVTVEPFFMDRTEITNQEYQRFVAATGHRAPSHWQNGLFSDSEAKLPVVNVSWDDANAYANWAGKRLPTEAEWEFAARGTDGRLYPWGNAWNASASNAGHISGGQIAAVGSFPAGASPFGALDMCGNVWEWTASSLQNYSSGKEEMALVKVIRGGAFDVPSARATTTYRGALPADRLLDKTGFRTVRDIAKP